MFDSSRLLSEAESAEVAGVSLDTLRQYHQFGLLDAVDREGGRFFRESDIRTLFYTRSKRGANGEDDSALSAVERFVNRAVHAARRDEAGISPEDGPPPTLRQILAEPLPELEPEDDEAEAAASLQAVETEVVVPSLSSAEAPAAANGTEAPESVKVEASEQPTAVENFPSEVAPPQTTSPEPPAAVSAEPVSSPAHPETVSAAAETEAQQQPSAVERAPSAHELVGDPLNGTTPSDALSSPAIEKVSEVKEPQVPQSPAPEAKTPEAAVSETTAPETSAEPEVHAQGSKSPSELVEVNAVLREQIEILRQERDWLRERVEKLEARSEREQMLLLSESETIRSLVNLSQEDRKKSFWRFSLPWRS